MQPTTNASHLTYVQCCSHGGVRRSGGVAPNRLNAPHGRGYNVAQHL